MLGIIIHIYFQKSFGKTTHQKNDQPRPHCIGNSRPTVNRSAQWLIDWNKMVESMCGGFKYQVNFEKGSQYSESGPTLCFILCNDIY